MAGITASRHRETPGWLLRFFAWFDGIVNGRGDKMGSLNAHKRELDERLDSIGWGLLFLFFAALTLPSGTAGYASVAAIGSGMLVLSALRIATDIPVKWPSLILGTVMLTGGGGALVGVRMDLFALLFLLAGVVSIASALFRPKRLAAG